MLKVKYDILRRGGVNSKEPIWCISSLMLWQNPWQSNIRKGSLSAHIWDCIPSFARKSWQQGCGLITFAVGKQREMNTGKQLSFFLLFKPGAQPMARRCSHSGCVFPLQLKLSGNALTNKNRNISPRCFQIWSSWRSRFIITPLPLQL